MAILADCLKLPGLYSVLGDDTSGLNLYLDQMKKAFSKLSLSNWDGLMINNSKGFSDARDQLYSKYKGPRGDVNKHLAIEVDHAFPVQGVGSVILGTVMSGTVTKGQKIVVYPSGQTGQVRSIQVNDKEVKSASAGIHVGLAMKGILPRYLQRGTVIATPGEDSVIETQELSNIKLNKAAFGQTPKVGQRIHVVSGLFDSPGEIVSWNSTTTIKTDKMIPYYTDNRLTLLDLNSKPVVLGSKQN